MYIRRDEAWLQHHQRRSVREGLHEEYVIWSLRRTFPDGILNFVDDSAKGIVEMLFCTSLVALVGVADQPQSSPRKLQIVNTKVNICDVLDIPAASPEKLFLHHQNQALPNFDESLV